MARHHRARQEGADRSSPVELSAGAHGDYTVSLKYGGKVLAEQPWGVGRPWGVTLFWILVCLVVPAAVFRIGMAVVDRVRPRRAGGIRHRGLRLPELALHLPKFDRPRRKRRPPPLRPCRGSPRTPIRGRPAGSPHRTTTARRVLRLPPGRDPREQAKESHTGRHGEAGRGGRRAGARRGRGRAGTGRRARAGRRGVVRDALRAARGHRLPSTAPRRSRSPRRPRRRWATRSTSYGSSSRPPPRTRTSSTCPRTRSSRPAPSRRPAPRPPTSRCRGRGRTRPSPRAAPWCCPT